MRSSKILLTALAAAAGLVIGFGSPKDVWAINAVSIVAPESGVVKASQITGDSNYDHGDCQVQLVSHTGSSTVTLELDENVNMLQMNVNSGDDGELCDLVITGDKKLTIDNTGSSDSDITCRNLTVESVTIEAIAAADGAAIAAFDNVTINNGEVIVKNSYNGTSDLPSMGICAYNGELIINGGTVRSEDRDHAIRGGSGITVNGGTIEAKGTGKNGIGLYSEGAVTISNGTVTATGEKHGIYAKESPVKISGSSTVVNAKGNAGGGAIFADGGSITISEPLGVAKPEGGGISANGRFISKTSGASGDDDFATDVVIQKVDPKPEKKEEKEDKKDKDDDNDDEPAPVKPSNPVNPNLLSAKFYVNDSAVSGAVFVKETQGPRGIAAFHFNRPAGYSEAFSFNMIFKNKVDYTLKKGVLCLDIPPQYQKAGRTFAITAIDKAGKVHIFNDTDTNPATITCNIDIEGFAFDLIYKD